jgi:hypothetical protein
VWKKCPQRLGGDLQLLDGRQQRQRLARLALLGILAPGARDLPFSAQCLVAHPQLRGRVLVRILAVDALDVGVTTMDLVEILERVPDALNQLRVRILVGLVAMGEPPGPGAIHELVARRRRRIAGPRDPGAEAAPDQGLGVTVSDLVGVNLIAAEEQEMRPLLSRCGAQPVAETVEHVRSPVLAAALVAGIPAARPRREAQLPVVSPPECSEGEPLGSVGERRPAQLGFQRDFHLRGERGENAVELALADRYRTARRQRRQLERVVVDGVLGQTVELHRSEIPAPDADRGAVPRGCGGRTTRPIAHANHRRCDGLDPDDGALVVGVADKRAGAQLGRQGADAYLAQSAEERLGDPDGPASDVLVLEESLDAAAAQGFHTRLGDVVHLLPVVRPEVLVGVGVVAHQRPVEARAAVLDPHIVRIEKRPGTNDAHTVADLEHERLGRIDPGQHGAPVGVELASLDHGILEKRVLSIGERLIVVVDHVDRLSRRRRLCFRRRLVHERRGVRGAGGALRSRIDPDDDLTGGDDTPRVGDQSREEGEPAGRPASGLSDDRVSPR